MCLQIRVKDYSHQSLGSLWHRFQFIRVLLSPPVHQPGNICSVAHLLDLKMKDSFCQHQLWPAVIVESAISFEFLMEMKQGIFHERRSLFGCLSEVLLCSCFALVIHLNDEICERFVLALLEFQVLAISVVQSMGSILRLAPNYSLQFSTRISALMKICLCYSSPLLVVTYT